MLYFPRLQRKSISPANLAEYDRFAKKLQDQMGISNNLTTVEMVSGGTYIANQCAACYSHFVL